MISLFRDGVEVILFLLVFAAGMRADQKWPGMAKYFVWLFTTTEAVIKWLWHMALKLMPSTSK